MEETTRRSVLRRTGAAGIAGLAGISVTGSAAADEDLNRLLVGGYDQRGVRVDGIEVTVDGERVENYSDTDGYVECRLSTGTYTVAVHRDGYVTKTIETEVVEGTNTEFVDIVELATLEGTVTDRTGQPLEGADVRPAARFDPVDQDKHRHVETDEAGHYEFVLEPGEYGISVEATEHSGGHADIDPGAGASVTEDFTLENLSRDEPAQGTLSVELTDGDGGVPFVRASVDAQHDTVAQPETLTTVANEAGYYELDLEPGTYTVSYSSVSHDGGTHEVTVEAGETSDAVHELSPSLPAVAGNVYGPDGELEDGVTVHIGDGTTGYDLDADGEPQFLVSVPEGEHEVEAISEDNLYYASTTVEAEEGEVPVVDLELEIDPWSAGYF